MDFNVVVTDKEIDDELFLHGLVREEMCRPVRIGERCWIGGDVTICPGVTIGDRTVIGAGSVVVRDIPSDCVAVGNPCRVIKRVNGKQD